MIRLARVLMGMIVIWPAAALVLHRAFDVDPWRLFSFAMYATPPRMGESFGLELFVPAPPGLDSSITVNIDGGAFVRLLPSGDVLTEARRFSEKRRSLGTLASSRPLANLVASQNQARRVVVRTTTLSLGTDHYLHKQTFNDMYDFSQ